MLTQKHLIFDIDGTIWDTTVKIAEGLDSFVRDTPELSPYYPVTAERLRHEFGQPIHVIGDHLFPGVEKTRRDGLIDDFFLRANRLLKKSPVPPYDGIPETFRALSGSHSLYIVSNCEAGYATLVIDACGLAPYVRDHLCPCDTSVYKADNIRLMAEKWHFDLSDAVYIGDTALDEEASSEAGVTFIHAAYGYGRAAAPAAVIQKPADLIPLFGA